MSSSPERARRAARWVPLLPVLLALGACAEGVLDPSGDEASRVSGIWWLMFGLGTAIYVAVLVLLVAALRRGRRAAGDDVDERDGRRSRLAGMPLLLGGGLVVPVLVMLLLTGVTAMPTSRHDDGSLTVEVEGRQFWWRVGYPATDGAITANEVHIPVGEPVELVLTSPDVIHSFWVPELAGKIDLVPGRTNRMTIEADEPGVYQGRCAEYCGIAHAHMELLVIAEPPEEFERWLAREASPARSPSNEVELTGREVFLGSSCVYCHRIRGTNATSDFGPDLTHLASRRTLGAGVMPNTLGDLAGWIVDPQRHKPGNEMPAMRLSPEELQALLAYLETLE